MKIIKLLYKYGRSNIRTYQVGHIVCIVYSPILTKGPSRGVVNFLDYDIIVYEFVLQSRYYIHFRTNTHGKGTNSFILPANGKIVPLLCFYKEGR